MAKKPVETPPYVPRKGLRSTLDFLESRKAGETITREDLHKRGLSSHLTYPALAALRFLGLMDEQGRLTGQHTAFSREKPDLAVQETLVKEAYRDFFGSVPLPAQDLDTLKVRFQEVYELSDRVINSAFPLFQYITQEAGIPLLSEGQTVPIADEPRHVVHPSINIEGLEGPALAAAMEQASKDEPLRVKHTGYQIVINLQVTKHTTEKDIIKMVRTANRAVHLIKKAGDTR